MVIKTNNKIFDAFLGEIFTQINYIVRVGSSIKFTTFYTHHDLFKKTKKYDPI